MFTFLKKRKNVNYRTIGVAGSFGKTVVVSAVRQILKQNGAKVAFLSSEGYSVDGENINDSFSSDNITPAAFRDMLLALDEFAPDFFVIEMSARNIARDLFKNMDLDAGVITNVIGDTQNFKAWQSLADTKVEFMKMISSEGLLVVNGEDQNVVTWLSQHSSKLKQNIYCYWIDTRNLLEKRYSLGGISFKLDDAIKINTKLIGNHNFMNLYLATQVCSRYLPMEAISKAVENVENPKGSFNLAHTDPFRVIIDSAKLVEQVNDSLNYIKNTKAPTARLISIFGARPVAADERKILSEIVSDLSDIILLAPNDPNTFSVSNLNTELQNYAINRGGVVLDRFYSTQEVNMANKANLFNRMEMVRNNGSKPIVSFDAHDYTGRLDAIRLGVQVAKPGDIIYIFGKGNDKSIIFDNVEYEWSDYEALRIALSQVPHINPQY